MNILITNDDGYYAAGIKALVRAVKHLGTVTVIAPKYHQSGMSMAVSLGFKPVAVKEVGYEDGVRWMYLDGTPASCVKFGVDNVFTSEKPDVVLSGINHGSNAATAACYSGTLGAAQEAAVNGIPAIGVSLDNMKAGADFQAVETLFPEIFLKIMAAHDGRHGAYYNVNFPDIPLAQVKGVRVGYMGKGHWEKEFVDWDSGYFSRFGINHRDYGLESPDVKGEEGEKMYMMAGSFIDEDSNDSMADHRLVQAGYVSIVEHNFDNTDYSGIARLQASGLDWDY